MSRSVDHVHRLASAAAATLVFTMASGEFAAAATTAPTRLLTYVQRIDQTTDDVTTTATDYLEVFETGATRNIQLLSPSGATRAVSLETSADATSGPDPAAQCYRLATMLLPTVAQLAPGSRARGGELDVTSDAVMTKVPVNFAVQALAPRLERVFVYGDDSAPIHFTGALDLSRGVIMAATFTIAQSATHAMRCQMNVLLPKHAQPAPTTVL